MLRRHPCALLLPTLLGIGTFAGCSMTSPGAPRSAARPEIKTIASVGDRPLPPTTGEPGSAVTGEQSRPEPRRSPATRVSGRVVDERGRPVANATVRPADGASAGRIAVTTTDRAGGFTLNGLRAGGEYTLIAEYQTPDGEIKSGRIDAKASETDLEIALENDLDRGRLGAGESRRARSVSNREELDLDTPAQKPAKKPGRPSEINLDDIPTSEEIEAQGRSESDDNLDRPTPTRSSKPPMTGWKGWNNGTPPGDEERVSTGDEGEQDSPARRVSSRSSDDLPPAREADPAGAGSADEEDSNPLPPAIDPSSQSSAKPALSQRTTRENPVDPSPVEILKAEANAGGIRLASDTVAPPKVVWDQPATARNPEATRVPATPAMPAVEEKKMTWDEMLARLPKANDAPPVRVSSRPNARQTSLSVRQNQGGFLKSAPPPKTPGVESCKYDARNQRINDLRLPDPEGRLVSFQDIDADFVLLDFWGSWCQPCIRSIPHLVELQNKFGPRIKVVGIACEKGSFEQRSAKATNAADRLGVNYPVLISSAEEFSPVQDALKIQGFPTMILVDRSGKIVWREQGGANETMSRLDRVVASSASAGSTVRR